MDKRLEEIKERFKAMNELSSFKKLAPTELFFDDLDYLIQQAERVEELEDKLYKLNESAYETQIDFSEANGKKNSLLEQNQRYEQALERIAEHEVYGIDIRTGECLSTDAGEIAKSALRGDGDE